MDYPHVLREDAVADPTTAYVWYEHQQKDLGEQFQSAILKNKANIGQPLSLQNILQEISSGSGWQISFFNSLSDRWSKPIDINISYLSQKP